jgi:membrane protease YdiL (CAAX protease family)
MDSLSPPEQGQDDHLQQAGPVPHSLKDTVLTHGPALEWIDWGVRLAVFSIAVISLSSPLIIRASNGDGLWSLGILAGLVGIYLLGSIEPIARHVYGWALASPVIMALPPLLLLIPYAVIGRRTAQADVSDILTTCLLLFLPTALALMNAPRLRSADVTLGLIAVAFPLFVPLMRNETIAGSDIWLRTAAFVLPVLLLLLTTRRQKERLNFLFACAVLALWYSIEFNAFPRFNLPALTTAISYFHLIAICTFLYILIIAGRFGRLGLSFQPTPRGLSVVATNMALFALLAVPIGLVSGFIRPGLAWTNTVDALMRAFAIYLTVALPEEILFRGSVLPYLSDTLRGPEALTIILSALVFGAAHLNNPPNVGWYFVLASVAGVFYARIYLATKNVAAAATLHTIVDWVWSTLFTG